MGRSTNGTYSLPKLPFVSGTTISSTDVNANFSDIALALTQSLSRYGDGDMQTELRVPDGSAAAPTLSFTAETGTGFWRPGNFQLGLTMQAAQLQTWTLTAITMTRPTTITTAQTNTAGLTSTGNGTGAGVAGTGGATGNGVTGTGGATSGAGGVFTGTGGGNGVTATGQGAGSGVNGTGGATGVGVRGAGGATSGAGGTFTGGPSSAGVTATGGTNGNGATLTGSGTGFGAVITGGATGDGATITSVASSGTGAIITGGAGGVGLRARAGTAATATVPTYDVVPERGYIAFADAVVSPNSNVALKNALTPSGVEKVWGVFTTNGAGGVTVDSGQNITSAVLSGGNLVVTFAQSFSGAKTYVPTPGRDVSGYVRAITVTNTSVTLQAFSLVAGAEAVDNMSTTAMVVRLRCVGLQ